MNALSLTFDVPANIDKESQLLILIERAIIYHKTMYNFEGHVDAVEAIKRVLQLHQSRLETGFYS